MFNFSTNHYTMDHVASYLLSHQLVPFPLYNPTAESYLKKFFQLFNTITDYLWSTNSKSLPFENPSLGYMNLSPQLHPFRLTLFLLDIAAFCRSWICHRNGMSKLGNGRGRNCIFQVILLLNSILLICKCMMIFKYVSACCTNPCYKTTFSQSRRSFHPPHHTQICLLPQEF